MLTIIDIVSHDLNAEVRHWVETFLRKKNCADSFGFLKMAEFEGDELFQTV